MGTKYISFSVTDDGVTHNVEAEFNDFATWMELLYPVASCLSAAYGYDIKNKITVNGRDLEYGVWQTEMRKLEMELEDELEESKPKKKGKMKKKESFLMGKPEDWEDE